MVFLFCKLKEKTPFNIFTNQPEAYFRQGYKGGSSAPSSDLPKVKKQGCVRAFVLMGLFSPSLDSSVSAVGSSIFPSGGVIIAYTVEMINHVCKVR